MQAVILQLLPLLARACQEAPSAAQRTEASTQGLACALLSGLVAGCGAARHAALSASWLHTPRMLDRSCQVRRCQVTALPWVCAELSYQVIGSDSGLRACIASLAVNCTQKCCCAQRVLAAHSVHAGPQLPGGQIWMPGP